MQSMQQSVSRIQIVSSHIKYPCERQSVCVCVREQETAGICLCMPGVCVQCVFMCLLGSGLPVWADGLDISLQNRELMCSVSVCVCVSGQVWCYEEADGVYGDGSDGGTAHTCIGAQRGNGWRWHRWVCDITSRTEQDWNKMHNAISVKGFPYDCWALSKNYQSLPESFWQNWRVIWEDFHEFDGPWLSGEG